jgi:hypothetical protein
MFMFSDALEDCPEIQKIIRETGSSVLHSEEKWISGEEDVTNLRLRFPFPYCEKN